MTPLRHHVLGLFAFLTTLLPARAESAQFCKSDSPATAGTEVNFCAGVGFFQNTTSGSHDLYLTLTTRRHHGSALGWTAVGPGNVMADSLMFIVYGDPSGDADPVVSIRTSPEGHHQPELVQQAGTGVADFRVLRTAWVPVDENGSAADDQAYDAVVSVVCYSCAELPGIALDAQSSSQSWIWAWHATQEFDDFSEDVHLLMHTHHAGAGGFGNFYVDSASTIVVDGIPSVPVIQPGGAAINAAEVPLEKPTTVGGFRAFLTSPHFHVHGVMMGTAFTFLFPLGLVMLRRGGSKAFRFHWVVQLSAFVLAFLGLCIGLLLRSRISTIHQFVGIVVVTALGIQAVLGWRHHVLFLQLHRRTWISHLHIYLGRVAMIVGAGNILTGMVLFGHGRVSVPLMGLLLLLIFIGISFWLWKSQRTRQRQNRGAGVAEETRYFALSESDDEDSNADEQIGLKRLSPS